MKRLLIILSLAVTACGVAVAPIQPQEQPIQRVQFPSISAAPVPELVQMTVIAESLNVRKCGSYSCDSIGEWLHTGQIVTVRSRNENNWCDIGRGWVACWWLE